MDDNDTTACQLTVTYLESTLKRFFSQTEKNPIERFHRLGSQLGTIQETLSKHAEDIKTQQSITSTLQVRIKNAEDITSQPSEILNQLENELVSFEDRSR